MAERTTIAVRTVTWEMQESFAALSGDRNPMHMDAMVARRTYAGAPVVHGIHTLLWALESLAAAGILTRPLERIKAKFLKWIYVGSEAALTVAAVQSDPPALSIEVQGLVIMTVELTYRDGEPDLQALRARGERREVPRDLSFAQMAGLRAESFVAGTAAAAAVFPALARVYGPALVAELAATSYVVGMEAPGLHSTFSKIDLAVRGAAEEGAAEEFDRGLIYEVIYQDERFRKARLRIAGAAVEGTLEVFVRSPPSLQATMQELGEVVVPGEFRGMRALIVGGSRGLGEVTAKLVAAGGGHAILTYAVGRAEAEQVQGEIRSAGGQADVLAFDVRKAPETQLAALQAPPTHLFYFATNAIFQPRYNAFSADVFAEFFRFYVTGFYDLCAALLARQQKLRAYYPSSVAVEERPQGMTEYSMAKAAGEILCAEMNRDLPGFNTSLTRLPRLPTDQTAGVLPARAVSPVQILLPIVRERMGANGSPAETPPSEP